MCSSSFRAVSPVVRELCNSGGAVLDRVVHGESFVVTRDGAPVAGLSPLRRAALRPLS